MSVIGIVNTLTSESVVISRKMFVRYLNNVDIGNWYPFLTFRYRIEHVHIVKT